MYNRFLPSPELLNQELARYKSHYLQKATEQRPDSCASAMKDINETLYSNLSVLLRIASTLPVTSCECERSASALRRLHTWSRSSMTQERLSALALTHIHYDVVVDLEEVADRFAKKHSRKMELDSLLLA